MKWPALALIVLGLLFCVDAFVPRSKPIPQPVKSELVIGGALLISGILTGLLGFLHQRRRS